MLRRYARVFQSVYHTLRNLVVLNLYMHSDAYARYAWLHEFLEIITTP